MYLVVKHSGIYSTMLPSIVISIVLASFVSAESSITEAPTTTAEDNPYTIYPSVAKTASINGFADRIYDQLPECAKPCMFQNTGVTPCPYWDTGCCVLCQHLLVPLVLVLLRSVKAKTLLLLQVWELPFVPLLV